MFVLDKKLFLKSLFAEVHEFLRAFVEMAALFPNDSRADGDWRSERHMDKFGRFGKHAFEQETSAVSAAEKFQHGRQLTGIENHARLNAKLFKPLRQNFVLHGILMKKKKILPVKLRHVDLRQLCKRMIFADAKHEFVLR